MLSCMWCCSVWTCALSAAVYYLIEPKLIIAVAAMTIAVLFAEYLGQLEASP